MKDAHFPPFFPTHFLLLEGEAFVEIVSLILLKKCVGEAL
jgi:hypothetical protein